MQRFDFQRIISLVTPYAERAARASGLLISALLILVIYREFRTADFSFLHGNLVASPLFWIVFVASYCISPFCEWVIYNRLWGFDWQAFPALMRKLVSNELLLGYLGEVQFTVWAHSRHGERITPFHAIKDVTILSALTGNVVTLALLGFAWPLIAASQWGLPARTVFIGLGIVLGTSFVALLARRQIFSLARRELIEIAAIQTARTLLAIILNAIMWHIAIPGQQGSSWFVLATLRMLVSRLPLVPNKDLVFAGLIIVVLGPGTEVAGLMATMAGLIMLTHLVVGSILVTADFVRTSRA